MLFKYLKTSYSTFIEPFIELVALANVVIIAVNARMKAHHRRGRRHRHRRPRGGREGVRCSHPDVNPTRNRNMRYSDSLHENHDNKVARLLSLFP